MTKQPIYLDYNATTPIDPQVADAMLPYLYDHFGNPSSSHAYGVEAKLGVEKARRQVAAMLGCHAEEVIFTSGGSESNNFAIKGTAFAQRARGNHIITSAIEHPAVLECAVTPCTVDGLLAPLAHIVPAPGFADSPGLALALRNFATEHLPPPLRPVRFVFRAALPKTRTGKINRSLIAQEE